MLLRPYCSLASSNYVIQAKRAEVEAEVAKLEAELEALGNVDTLTTRKDELKVQIRAGQTRLTQLRNDEKQINESLAGVNNTIAELERQIAEEQARLETRSRAHSLHPRHGRGVPERRRLATKVKLRRTAGQHLLAHWGGRALIRVESSAKVKSLIRTRLLLLRRLAVRRGDYYRLV